MSEEKEEFSERVNARIRKLVERAKEAEAKASEAVSKLTETEAHIATLEKTVTQHQDLTAQMASKDEEIAGIKRGFETERAVLGAGITDPEGVEMAKLFHSKLGEDAPPMSEWLAGDSLPKAVSAYVPAAPSAAAPSVPDAPVAAPTQPVTANAGAAPQPTYERKADLKHALQNPDYYKANRHLFVTEDGKAIK